LSLILDETNFYHTIFTLGLNYELKGFPFRREKIIEFFILFFKEQVEKEFTFKVVKTRKRVHVRNCLKKIHIIK